MARKNSINTEAITQEIPGFDDFQTPDFETFGIEFFNTGQNDDPDDSRYVRPPIYKRRKEEHLYFEYAQQLANKIDLRGGDSLFILVSGNFVFGDFLEALFYEKQIVTERLQISTLSMSYYNVLSLKNLMTGGFVENIDLIISDYFFAHERRGIIEDLYRELDFENRFQLGVSGSHTKITSFKTLGGKHYVMHGSANLRSANCIEQLRIEDNEELFNFVTEYNKTVLNRYSTINKSARGRTLWAELAGKSKRTKGPTKK